MKGKEIIIYYAIALIGGITTGGLFARAQYHKGQRDAYAKMAEELDALRKNVEEELEKRKENEAE